MHRSITDVVRSTVRAAAEETIHRHQVLSLSVHDSAAFVDALMNPTAPGTDLVAAAKAHRERIGGYHNGHAIHCRAARSSPRPSGLFLR